MNPDSPIAASVVPAAWSSVFRGRRVLLTGHTGFKGTWLALWLCRMGAIVDGLALEPRTTPNLYEAIDLRSRLRSDRRVDIRDWPRVCEQVAACDPELIVHLAALPLVRESYSHPRETFETNVQGTCNVLEAVRQRRQPCAVIVVTSDKCYENREQVWGYRECDAMGGSDPYSASKGAAELVVASYRRSFFPPSRWHEHGVQLASVRAGNVIGGGDWSADRIIPDAVRSLVLGQLVPVRNPTAIRPWQHVLEPLSGYITLAARMLTQPSACWCDGWNFGPVPGEEATVAELVTAFCQAWGNSAAWTDQRSPQAPQEAHCLRLSIDKAITELGWKPRWSFAETIRRTAHWYRQFHSTADSATTLCENDIDAYSSLLLTADRGSSDADRGSPTTVDRGSLGADR